jgi:ribonuclease BN (tRNA processing enzyme)
VNLIVLGSGTGVPSLTRNAPGYYVRALDQDILVDCGSGTLLQLERAGSSYRTIDAVFLTHTHPDHIGDLIPLIHALKVTPGFRREKPLPIFGPAGFLEFYTKYISPVVTRPKHFSVEVREVDSEFDFAGVRCLTSPTVHSNRLNSIAYRLEDGDKALVLSGDCDYDTGIVELSRQADLLVLDCSCPDALKFPGHLSATECGRVGTEAGVKRLLLSHLYPVVGAEDTRLDECRSVFPGDVQLAEDLMGYDL